jgi:hypothetical protein
MDGSGCPRATKGSMTAADFDHCAADLGQCPDHPVFVAAGFKVNA